METTQTVRKSDHTLSKPITLSHLDRTLLREWIAERKRELEARTPEGLRETLADAMNGRQTR